MGLLIFSFLFFPFLFWLDLSILTHPTAMMQNLNQVPEWTFIHLEVNFFIYYISCLTYTNSFLNGSVQFAAECMLDQFHGLYIQFYFNNFLNYFQQISTTPSNFAHQPAVSSWFFSFFSFLFFFSFCSFLKWALVLMDSFKSTVQQRSSYWWFSQGMQEFIFTFLAQMGSS